MYTNQLWTICTYMELWFEGKKMGSSKNCFLDFRVSGSQKYFCEYLCESKNIFENIWDVDLGPRYYWIMKNTIVHKSPDTVPLIMSLVYGAYLGVQILSRSWLIKNYSLRNLVLWGVTQRLLEHKVKQITIFTQLKHEKNSIWPGSPLWICTNFLILQTTMNKNNI